MNDMPTIAPMLPNNNPTKDSSLDDLAVFAMLKQDEILARDKKNGEDLWLMGQALAWAKAKVQHGQWEKWWKAKGFKKTYVWQARRLHESASLEDVQELGVTEALLTFGVIAEKKEKESVLNAKPKKEDDELPAAPEPAEQGQYDGEESTPDEAPADDLADEEDKELKEYQESIRKLTPKTKAVAIHHALEQLRDELNGDEVDQELRQTLGEIARLAEELKGVSKTVEAA
jgi:hypothetical protein